MLKKEGLTKFNEQKNHSEHLFMNTQEPLIFVVDDDEDDREMLLSAFAENGSLDNVKMFSSNTELLKALDQVEESSLPKLVILDQQTPGNTGSDMLAILKSSERYKQMPVVIYSSSMPTHLKEKINRWEATACMEKAGNLDELQQHIELFKQIAR